MVPIILTASLLGVALTGSYLKAQKALISTQHEPSVIKPHQPPALLKAILVKHGFELQSRTALTNSQLYVAHSYHSEQCTGSLTTLELQRNGEGATLLASRDTQDTRYLFQSDWYLQYPAVQHGWNRFLNAVSSVLPFPMQSTSAEVWAVATDGDCGKQIWPT